MKANRDHRFCKDKPYLQRRSPSKRAFVGLAGREVSVDTPATTPADVCVEIAEPQTMPAAEAWTPA